MFGLLCLPDFAEPFLAGFALADLAHLRVKILKPLALGVRWNFDGPFFRNKGHLIVSILVCRAVKDRTDSLADRHVVSSPVRIEQDAVAIFRTAI